MNLFYILLLFPVIILSQEFKLNDTVFNYQAFLKQRFNYEISNQTRIKYITKQEMYNRLYNKRKPHDSSSLKQIDRIIKKRWAAGFNEFIEELYTVDPMDTTIMHGLYIEFGGDTTLYSVGKYNKGVKDSVWFHKTIEGYVYKRNYKNGKQDGIQIIEDKEGSKSVIKFKNDVPIDTGYLYYPSGKIQSLDVYKNGNLFSSKCFRENGKPVDCTTMAME